MNMVKKVDNCIKVFVSVLILSVLFAVSAKNILAETSSSTLYIPLIGITSVPDSLALPDGVGDVTYHYAVKTFIPELPLSDVRVVDDTCSPVTFAEGDDNGNLQLDYSETWRYVCTTKVSTTTQSVATATGIANNITATHKAYATVVVGRKDPAPLVSIVNITKVAYPLSLPAQGGPIVFTYRVNNPGEVPLSDVTVLDDKCSAISGKLGDRNGNGLLDTNEVWIYTCIVVLTETTTNTVTVTAYANGLKAISSDTITVKVDTPGSPEVESAPGFPDQPIPDFPETGLNVSVKIIVWAVLAGILAILIVVFVLKRRAEKI